MKMKRYSVILLPVMLFACQTMGKFAPFAEKQAAQPKGRPQPMVKSQAKPSLPAGVPLTQVGLAHKQHMYDCIENTSAPTTLRFPNPKLNFFPHLPDPFLSFHLTEENGWPFLVGYYKRENYTPAGDYLVALRGEASGWHKSAATNAVLSLIDNTQNNALVFIDEYNYIKKEKEKSRLKTVMPICHRS